MSELARILIIDDDRQIVEVVAACLNGEGYAVSRAYDGEEGLRLALDTRPDLILLDLMLPKRSGLDVVRALRPQTNVPVVILSARDSETDRTVGLELGADDYVTKPFSARELVARIGAVLRRSHCSCGAERNSQWSGPEGVEIDRETRQVRRNGKPVSLTPTEYRILDVLIRHRGQILSRSQLLEHVAAHGDVFDRTLDKHIANLRKKIEDNPSRPRHVVTVFGLGYRFPA
ncbi:MAG: two-component system, OmpR family, response regulator VicR [Candidatus Eremiobacteraeota bacterium]|jgi:DNA-binding response OmpR family regulator|nr:two-component system, OmpR family, response regulator VicR [Candidatus Eremiobacteraeota bacterium]